jgi:GNAT superfamily N-acetyltransferase
LAQKDGKQAVPDLTVRPTPEFEFVDVYELLQLNDSRFNALFEAFKRVYADAFPDAREREDPHKWPRRWTGEEPPPQPHMFVLLAVRHGEVLGGICVEHYRLSRCGLLTYVAVDARERGRGIGRALIREAMARLKQRCNPSLRAIFAEAQIPSKMASALQGAARKRIAFMRRLGARPLDLEYVQPALEEGKERARHLMLLVLDHDKPHLSRNVLHEFMDEFYRALTGEDPKGDKDFQAMLRRTADYALTDFEDPVLAAADVAFCLHYLEQSEDRLTEAEKCPVFRSMELDLLSYAFQSPPPLQSTCESIESPDVDRTQDYGVELEVEYPTITEYQSEGRRHYLYCVDRRRQLKAYVASTRFRNSNIVVWHVILRPAHGVTLNEFDLIKLGKLYGERTEETSLLGDAGIRFRRTDRTGDVDATRLLELLHSGGHHASKPVAGTLEWNVTDTAPPEDVVNRLVGLSDVEAVATLANIADENTLQSRQLKALCGVITGILDFSQIDGAEAVDTMAPTYIRRGTYMRVHRASLVQVCQEDRAMQAVTGTVGISPYLIIPHAAVLFNESLLGVGEGDAKRTTQLQKRLATMNHNLRKAWLQNVFAYETERTLFKRALLDRGAEDRYITLAQQAKETEALIEQRLKTRQDILQVVITLLLGLLSVLSVKKELSNLLGLDEKYVLYSALLLAVLFVWAMYRLAKRDDE